MTLKQATIEHAKAWKQLSHDLLLSATTQKEFVESAIWCGKEAHALRGISKDVQKTIAQWLWANKDAIMSGTFILTHSASEGIIVKPWPLSWISKICHILNPHAYPLIFDSQVREKLHKHTFNQWHEEMKKERDEVVSMTNAEIYDKESTIWAK